MIGTGNLLSFILSMIVSFGTIDLSYRIYMLYGDGIVGWSVSPRLTQYLGYRYELFDLIYITLLGLPSLGL